MIGGKNYHNSLIKTFSFPKAYSSFMISFNFWIIDHVAINGASVYATVNDWRFWEMNLSSEAKFSYET